MICLYCGIAIAVTDSMEMTREGWSHAACALRAMPTIREPFTPPDPTGAAMASRIAEFLGGTASEARAKDLAQIIIIDFDVRPRLAVSR